MDTEFVVEDVEAIIKTRTKRCYVLRLSLQQTFADTEYDESKVSVWTNAVIGNCLKALLALERPFKYVVTCFIMQKNGAGMYTAAGAFWDTKRDGLCRVPWENGTMNVIVTVFGTAMAPSSQEGA